MKQRITALMRQKKFWPDGGLTLVRSVLHFGNALLSPEVHEKRHYRNSVGSLPVDRETLSSLYRQVGSVSYLE